MSHQPELQFTTDGNDLLVAASVEANNSPHVLWTRVHVLRARVIPAGGRVEDAVKKHEISLHYYVFQNRDLYCRSRKKVEVIWRLRDHRKGSETYKIVETFDPDSEEMKRLLPQLEVLARQLV